MGIRKVVVFGSCVVAGLLGCIPTTVLASPADDLQSYYAEAEVTSEEINRLRGELEKLSVSISEHEAAIEDKSVELASARESLATFVAEDYKDGDVSLVDILMNSESLSDAISRIQAFIAVNDYRCETIDRVECLESELKAEQFDLEQDKMSKESDLVDVEARQAELNAKIAEAEAYKASLPTETLASMVREVADAQNLDTAVVNEVLAALSSPDVATDVVAVNVENNGQEVVSSVDMNSVSAVGNDDSAVSTVSSPDAQEVAQQIVSAVSANPGTADSEYAQRVVEAALSQVGKAYVWGTSDPGVSFDCSGLTMYAYGVAGYDISHYSEDQAQYCTKSVEDAEVGDILWKPGHVGIYIGNGQTVEAFNPERGVGIGSADRFVSAGSPASFGL